MTRIRVLGDNPDGHAGEAAISEALTEALGLHGEVVRNTRDYDVLVVAGGADMAFGERQFLAKMTAIAKAQTLGRPTYLVNALWQENPEGFEDILGGLEGLTLGGPASARDLHKRHGLFADYTLDLGYFAPIHDTHPVTNFHGGIVATDIWTDRLGYAHPRGTDWALLDLDEISWSSLVRSLRTARVLVTGRLHGMIAALKARVPFVPIRGRDHGALDLLETAGATIPIANSVQEASLLIPWAERNQKIYDALFDWAEAQPKWRLDRCRPPSTEGTLPSEGASIVDQAQSAMTRRDFVAADRGFKAAIKAFKGRVPNPRLAAMAAAGVGDGPRALKIIADARAAKPGAFAYVKTLHQMSRDLGLWLRRDPAPEWWEGLRRASFLADVGEAEEGAKEAAQAILSIDDPVLATSVRFLIACRFIPLRQQAMARQLFRTLPVKNAPEEMLMQEQLFFYAETRDFGDHSEDVLDRAPESAAWSDPAFRHTALSYRTLRFGVTPAELELRVAAVEEFPTHPLLRDRLISDACEAGAFEALDALPPEVLRDAAPRNLVLAKEMHSRALARFPAHHFLFEHMEEERAKLMELLADRSKSIAVVGNSPIELGLKKGPQIDAHNIVIRFNDFDVGPQFAPDYGTKTDIHMQTYPIYQRKDFTRPPKGALLVQRNAFNIFEPRDWSPVITAFEQGQRITWLDRKTFLDPAEALMGSPSAGLSLAHLMKQLRGKLDRSSFFGFSFVDQLYGDQKAHYFNDERPSLLHDWAREAAHFERLFERG